MLSLTTVSIDYWITGDFVRSFFLNGISIQWSSSLTCHDLVVNSDSQCSQLHKYGWKTITVASGLCNSDTRDLYLIENPCLESITVNANSLRLFNSLIIANNPQLRSIQIANGQIWGTSYVAPFEKVKNLIISSNGYIR